jgi:hypothetical protein
MKILLLILSQRKCQVSSIHLSLVLLEFIISQDDLADIHRTVTKSLADILERGEKLDAIESKAGLPICLKVCECSKFKLFSWNRLFKR